MRRNSNACNGASSSDNKLEKDKICSNVSSMVRLNDDLPEILKTKIKQEKDSSISSNLVESSKPFSNKDLHKKFIMPTSKGQEVSSSIKGITNTRYYNYYLPRKCPLWIVI